MRLQTRREKSDTDRLIRVLREELSKTKGQLRKQVDANLRLARRTSVAEGSMAGARATLADAYRKLRDENARLRKDNERLSRRLDDALGRTPAQIAAIESGKGEPRKQPVAE